MRSINQLLQITVMLMMCNATFAQSTTPGNVWNGFPNEFLGWDLSPVNTISLNIKHELDQPIHFYTNAGAGNKPSFPFLSKLKLFTTP